MKIFILEDNEYRRDYFFKFFSEEKPDNEIIMAQDVEQAKKYIPQYKFDEMFLDHDLGGIEGQDIKSETTGSEVVRFIVENNLQRNANICIHSQNPQGAKYMYDTLHYAGYSVYLRPFTLIYNEIERRGE